MTEAKLLKSIDGLELWSAGSEAKEHFAVKVGSRRARVLTTLAEAESYFTAALHRIRAFRSH